MPRWLFRVMLGIMLLIPLVLTLPAHAQNGEFTVSIDPTSGPSSTTVTINGSDAPPETELIVGFAPWNEDQNCATPRNGETVETITTDEHGNFSTTHEAERLDENHVGNAYYAYEPTQNPPEVMSNLACFELTAEETESVNIYLVAVDDSGESGILIGCDDSLVPVEVEIQSEDTTDAKIEAALAELLSINEQYYGQSGLYNALYQSDLSVESVTIENGDATVNLSGELRSGGVCDDPRIEHQILQTVLQFDGVDTATILLNGEMLFEGPGDDGPPEPSEADRPVFQNLTPAPHSTVEPGAVRLAVIAYADSEIESFSLLLNGEELNPEVGGPTEYLISAFTERTLTEGVYTLTAMATDADGDSFSAQWTFIVADDQSEGEWFGADGDPKADNINATLTTLVEAFRWHLYGQDWDPPVPPVPDLPTHASVYSLAEPLEEWVSGNEFDQDLTEATLRSLVEAFRWHFYGQDWDPPVPPSPDMPTHATEFSGPEPIDPWFTAGGDPIEENISATLRSLVESFRWHFWGYSWDGSHHFEIPTHSYD